MLKSVFQFNVIVILALFAQLSFAQVTDNDQAVSSDYPVEISRSACLSPKALSAAKKVVDGNEGSLQAARSLSRHYGECAEDAEGEVLKYSRLAASFGFAEDIWNLAAALEDRGQEEEAFPLFLKVAKQGDLLAIQRVSRAYAEGVGIAKDDKEAAVWLEAGARRCDVESAATLARLLGSGGESDRLRALTWALISLRERRSDAIEELAGDLKRGLNSADQRYAQELADSIVSRLSCM